MSPSLAWSPIAAAIAARRQPPVAVASDGGPSSSVSLRDDHRGMTARLHRQFLHHPGRGAAEQPAQLARAGEGARPRARPPFRHDGDGLSGDPVEHARGGAPPPRPATRRRRTPRRWPGWSPPGSPVRGAHPPAVQVEEPARPAPVGAVGHGMSPPIRGHRGAGLERIGAAFPPRWRGSRAVRRRDRANPLRPGRAAARRRGTRARARVPPSPPRSAANDGAPPDLTGFVPTWVETLALPARASGRSAISGWQASVSRATSCTRWSWPRRWSGAPSPRRGRRAPPRRCACARTRGRQARPRRKR